MALFRLIRCQIQRSLSVAQISNLISSHYTGVQKITDKCLLEIRHVRTFSEVASTKKFVTGFDDLPELERYFTSKFAYYDLKSAILDQIVKKLTQILMRSQPGADENVQRIFQLANASQKEQRKVVENELVKKCQNSQERKIAKMTVSIQNLEDHLEKMRNKDKHNKVYLQWLKDQRGKKLKNLKLSNFERYVEFIKEFNIEPLPSTFSKYAKYKFRRFKIGVEIKEKSQAVRKMPSLKKTL